MSSPLLQVSGLVKSYGGQRVTDHLEFALEEGEIRCLIGPNGAGKSTLLQMITGLIRPDDGNIVFAGMDITGIPTHRRAALGIGVKFQIPSIFPQLPVRQNVRIAVESAGVGSPANEVDRLLDTFGLAHRGSDQASHLAHGQKQWLEIAMAIARRPRLLLLDEPTAGMSPAETAKTGDLVLELNRQGLTLLAVEHDMRFVEQVATGVTVLQAGSIYIDGTPEVVMRHEGVAAIYLGGGP